MPLTHFFWHSVIHNPVFGSRPPDLSAVCVFARSESVDPFVASLAFELWNYISSQLESNNAANEVTASLPHTTNPDSVRTGGQDDFYSPQRFNPYLHPNQRAATFSHSQGGVLRAFVSRGVTGLFVSTAEETAFVQITYFWIRKADIWINSFTTCSHRGFYGLY